MSVWDYYREHLGLEPLDDALAEVSLTSALGKACKAVIDRASHVKSNPRKDQVVQMVDEVLDLLGRDRDLAQRRIKDGLVKARAAGKRFGRSRIDGKLETKIRKALRKGDRGMHRIAAEFGVGTGTVQRIARELKKGRPRATIPMTD